MHKLTVRDIDVLKKRVLVRVDFNVPIDETTRTITDDSRIRAALPTIKFLIEHDARVILISHLGRPKGKVVEVLRLTAIAQRLSQILGQQVGVATDCIGDEVEKSVATLNSGDVLLLENLRFHSDEETGSESFARSLARLGDVFVNDAFGTSHRAHASIAEIAHYLPAVAGFLLEKELNNLGKLLEDTERPLCAMMGGAKVSDKVDILKNLMARTDCLIIGGGMAATFLKAQGYGIGRSLIEEDSTDTAAAILEAAARQNIEVLLPRDVVVAHENKDSAKTSVLPVSEIPEDMMIVDIGPETIVRFSECISRCRTIFWNGPVGIYEIPAFTRGTRILAEKMAESDVTTIIGGGSTAEVVNELGLAGKMTFVSTGGGASMAFLSGEVLPGVAALMDRDDKTQNQ